MVADEHSGSSEEGAAPTRHRAISPIRRLVNARLLLSMCALILGIMAYQWNVPWSAALAGFLAIAAAIMVFPGPARTSLRMRTASSTTAIWPDTATKRVVDTMPDPTIILDRRGVVRYRNRIATDAFPGIKAGDPLGFTMRDPDLAAALQQSLSTQEVTEVLYIERVPTERVFKARYSPLSVYDKEPFGQTADFHILTFRDQSEITKAERLRTDFVANASHELRTPLASLQGFIETLQGRAKDDPAAREQFLAVMHSQAERMTRLIDDLLSLSRIEMRAHVKPSDQVDLVEIVRHVCDAMNPVATEFGVRIVFDRPVGQPAWVAGDRDELVQVVGNLVENAIKYGQDGQKVEIRLTFEKPDSEGQSGHAVLEVQDWGPGIAKEHIPRLTERFYRVDIETSREKKGTGLGLAIVKHILARHQARLSIESDVGSGSVFSVSFPLDGELDKQIQ